jgi:RimJ/RimL family protein N-acetyltransferase
MAERENMPKTVECRRLVATEAQIYQALRLDAFRCEPSAFRYAPEDESDVPLAAVEERLQRDHVIGAFAGGELVGIGGLAFNTGVKTRHKALLYGMYVGETFRGSGAADAIVTALVDAARGRVEIVTLTVVAQNERARRFYERWGFRAYGVEARAIRLAQDAYLDELLMSMSL